MEEIIEGVFHWKAVHPNTDSEAGCHFVAASGTAIDPLLPDEGIEWFDGRGVERIVLSTRHHLRHTPEIAERFGCPILCVTSPPSMSSRTVQRSRDSPLATALPLTSPPSR